MKVSSPIWLKIGCHGNVPGRIGKKEVQINNLQTNTYHLLKKIVKIGPVDPEILWLKEIIKKKETINAWRSLAYSPLRRSVAP